MKVTPMSLPPDNPVGHLRFYPVPPVPVGPGPAGNNATTGPESFQNLLKAVSEADTPPAKPLDGLQSAAKARELLELTQRVKLRMNESLLRIVSDTDPENRSRYFLEEGLRDILSSGAEEDAYPSIIRQGPSETDTPPPQVLEPKLKKSAEALTDRRGMSEIDEIIREAAETYDVAPELIKGVIQAESSFNPNAISPKGAMGLMQLMPGTAKELGVTDPMDPTSNVMGGTRYLKKLLDRYEGSVPLALAAYNWGMGNLDSHRGRMPAETRNYVAKVTKSYRESTDALA